MNEPTSNAVPPLLNSLLQGLAYGAFVIIAPIFNFAIARIWSELLSQSGDLPTYVFLLMSPEAALWMFPLLIYSVFSYLLLISNEENASRSFLIRFGVYTGLLLSFQYSLLTTLTLEFWARDAWFSDAGLSFFFIVFLPVIFSVILPKLKVWINNNKLVVKPLVDLGPGCLVFFLFILIALSIPVDLYFLPYYLIQAFPFWAFFIFLQASLWLWKHRKTKLTTLHGIGIVTWLTAYGLALRFNVLKMYELYAALPSQPPNCYIATAAANGHSAFVGSHEIQLGNGRLMRVNRQLQNLKCAELALMVAAPHMHKVLRFVYDVIGKTLARRIQNPFLADAVYLSLKPFEWMAAGVLKLAIPNWGDLASRIYIHSL